MALWIEYKLRHRTPHITNEQLTHCIVFQSTEPISVQLKVDIATKPKESARIHIMMMILSNLNTSAVGVSYVRQIDAKRVYPDVFNLKLSCQVRKVVIRDDGAHTS